MLHFVRANREGGWQLHLTSLNAMIPYFFVHDQTNHAHHSLLYLATMKELEHNDGDSWNYLKENFSVNKSGIPFCSSGSDHALEQENGSLKVTGVKRLTQEPTALYRYCLIAPSLNDISKSFCKEHKIEPTEREAHYQLRGSTSSRIEEKNVQNVLESLDTFGVDFKEESCVFSIVTKAVLAESSAAELLNHRSIGQDLYELFSNK